MKMTITTTALIMLLVAAAPQDVRAQEATYFKLTGVTLSDGTSAKGIFVIGNGKMLYFDIQTNGVGKGSGVPIYYCFDNSSSVPPPSAQSCATAGTDGSAVTEGMGFVGSNPVWGGANNGSGPPIPGTVNTSVYFLSPVGSVLTLTAPGTAFTAQALSYGTQGQAINLCVQGNAGGALPSNITCDKPYGYPWVGGPQGKYLGDFLSNEVFFPTFVPGLEYRQAVGRGVVSGTVAPCGAVFGQNGWSCETGQNTTAPK